MLLQVYAVYDSGISAWRLPMFARSKGEILRCWADAVNNPQSDFAKYPSDYTLFEVGSWDDANCKFDLLKTPVRIGVAIEFVKPVIPSAIEKGSGVSPA